MPLYIQPHWSQYDAICSAFTRRNGCTWTATANGIAATTGGRKRPTPDYVHNLVPRGEETVPSSPGWSIADAVHAASKYGMSLVNHSGDGWATLIDQLLAGHYVILQGDSDQFGNSTCSGEFNGDHCVGVHPLHRTKDGHRQWWINDGICPDGRWEYESKLKEYAQDLDHNIRFAAFLSRVPDTSHPAPKPPTPTGGKNVAIRYATVTATATKMTLKEDQALYDSPGGKVVTHMSKAASVPHVGLAGSVAGKAWRAVVVGTAGSYADGKVHRTVLYVPSSAGRIVKA